MSPRVRQVLYVLFLTGFLVSAPLVILYTAGFRFNIETGRISQTGLLSLGTVPKGATIFVDGKKQSQKTPAVLKNILPGDHHVRLEREGFSSWEKTLSVNSRSTTFATDIALFLERDPVALTTGDVVADAVDERTGSAAVAFASGESIEVWEIDGSDQTLIARLPTVESKDLALAWSDVDGVVEITTATGVQDIRVSHGTVTILPPPADAGGPLSIEPSGDRVALTRREGNGGQEIITTLPFGVYRLRPAPSGFAMVEDALRQHIFVIDLSDQAQPIMLSADASRWQWNEDNKRLLYGNGFDLHVYDVSTETDNTVTRVSEEMTGIAWYPPAAAVLYSQSGGLYAIELDDRDTRNVTTLATGESIRDIGTDPRGQAVTFVGTIGGVEGVWSKQLQR